MADVYCPRCGEPWDIAEFHDVPGFTFSEAYELFRQIGCRVFDTSHNSTPNSERAALARELYSLLGDDADGAAGELSDLCG
jgi:hypothetical protein